jgi:hypothetical protein
VPGRADRIGIGFVFHFSPGALLIAEGSCRLLKVFEGD